MKIDKCYAVIDNNNPEEFLRCSYKYPIPFYITLQEAKNALKGYKCRNRSYKTSYRIEEIILPHINRVVWEEEK